MLFRFTWKEQITVLSNGELSKSLVRIYDNEDASSHSSDNDAVENEKKTLPVEGLLGTEYGITPTLERR